MKDISVNRQQRLALGIATVIALLFGAYFLRTYFTLLVFTAIMAFIFNPVYQWFMRRGRSSKAAAILTLLISIFVIIIPLLVVMLISVYLLTGLVSNIRSASVNVNVNTLLEDVVRSANNLIDSFDVNYTLTVDAVRDAASNLIKATGLSILRGVSGSFNSIFGFFTAVIIYIYAFISLLTQQSRLLKTLKKANPLGGDIGRLYAERTAAMTKAMVKGQLIIAFLQGLINASFLYIAGFHSTFFFFLLLLTVLSVIPLGSGILVVPIGIVMILTGDVWQGILILAGHLLITTNVDNVLRPRLVPAEARLDPALTILSVFAGLRFFGFLGIILGPVIMILIVTTIQLFLDVYRGVALPKTEKTVKKPIVEKILSAIE